MFFTFRIYYIDYNYLKQNIINHITISPKKLKKYSIGNHDSRFIW